MEYRKFFYSWNAKNSNEKGHFLVIDKLRVKKF